MPTDKLLLESAKALAEAFNQEWIVNLRKTIEQSWRSNDSVADD